jgi:hypothetical protein
MNATLLYVALLVPGYGEKDVVERIVEAGGLYTGGGLLFMPEATTDGDLADLCELRHLKQLDLEGTQVTDNGLRTVSGLSRLEWLDIDATEITDKGLRHLEAMRNLRHLSVTQCPNITDTGVAELQRALPKCKIYR